jgi:hypothetical protein
MDGRRTHKLGVVSTRLIAPRSANIFLNKFPQILASQFFCLSFFSKMIFLFSQVYGFDAVLFVHQL